MGFRIEVLLQFLVFGLVMGVVGDLMTATLSGGGPIALKILGAMPLIAIPFAATDELIMDRMERFAKKRK